MGVDPGRLRRSDLEAAFHGVRSRRTPKAASDTAGQVPEALVRRAHLERARKYAAVMPEDAFYCGRTAAIILELPAPLREDSPLEVARCAPARGLRATGIRGVQVAGRLVIRGTYKGLPVTSPASTWAMLGRTLTCEELVVLGDSIVHRSRIPGTNRLDRQPHASIDDLRDMVDRGRREGRPRLREALDLIRTGSASPPETHLRLALLAEGFPEPSLDVDVYSASGGLLGASEIAYVREKVAFEYESEHHRVDRAQWNRDIQKYRDYREAGWDVIRVTNDLLYLRRWKLMLQARTALDSVASVVAKGWDPLRLSGS